MEYEREYKEDREREFTEDHDREFKCDECGEKCGIVEETFDYSGTHCTYGLAGTHHTGNYVSSCCLAEYIQVK